MNKLRNLISSGIVLSLSGIVMLASESIGFGTTRILIPSLIIASGVLAILFANANTNPQAKRPIQYLLYQGVAYIIFGLVGQTAIDNSL